MSYSLDKLPIILTDKSQKTQAIVVSELMAAPFAFLGVAGLWFNAVHGSLAWYFAVAGIVTLVAAFFAPWLLRSKANPPLIVIDESGVHAMISGQQRDFEWSRIARSRRVVIDPNAKIRSYGVQLIRKGEIASDETTGVLPPVGMDIDELEYFSRSGIARWGDEASSSSPDQSSAA